MIVQVDPYAFVLVCGVIGNPGRCEVQVRIDNEVDWAAVFEGAPGECKHVAATLRKCVELVSLRVQEATAARLREELRKAQDEDEGNDGGEPVIKPPDTKPPGGGGHSSPGGNGQHNRLARGGYF